jgi:hypothetical protein
MPLPGVFLNFGVRKWLSSAVENGSESGMKAAYRGDHLAETVYHHLMCR